MNREEFEKLEYIAEKLEYVYWSTQLECYTEKQGVRVCGFAAWVNGAWYAWQEQQKKMTQAYITLGEALNNTPDNYEDAIREAMDDLK